MPPHGSGFPGDVLERIDPWCWRIPRRFRAGMRVEGRVFASERLLPAILADLSLFQCVNVAALPGIRTASLVMPDVHQGYGFPIGGVAAMGLNDGVVSPGGVGFDISCGVRLLISSLTEAEIRPELRALLRTLVDAIPLGVGSQAKVSLSPGELDTILREGLPALLVRGLASEEDLLACEMGGHCPEADPDCVSPEAKARGRGQLGSLGSGNHFLEIQVVERVFHPPLAERFGLGLGQVVVMLHSGSRGLGHQVASDYIRLMGAVMAREGIVLPDRQLACAPIGSSEGRRYMAAMAAASHFAWCNRQMLTEQVRAAFFRHFKATLRTLYDVSHNMARVEGHQGEDGQRHNLLVHRKGATRAFPAGHVELSAPFRETGHPVLVPGDMGRASYVLVGLPGAMARTFGSVCHGAGRLLSRTAARRLQRCDQLEARLAAAGVMVYGASRRGVAEEAPEAYKDIEAVVDVLTGAGLARRVARLRPIGVLKG
ncbi:MAG: RtcB family protein [Candidatus Sericytochromatia bacterium]|nr:RtcB family protein [Candidatus Sericytochromatia bacterium]